jgi:hypothetical protein
MANHFNKSILTSSDLELLKAFENRRVTFHRLLEESNIIYSKKICSGCGFPTMDKSEAFGTCIICLWEGSAAEKNDTYQGAPNYISLIEHRINISSFLQLFKESHEIETDIDKIMEGIIHFEQGTLGIDRDNFENNLKNILPTKPKP